MYRRIQHADGKHRRSGRSAKPLVRIREPCKKLLTIKIKKRTYTISLRIVCDLVEKYETVTKPNRRADGRGVAVARGRNAPFPSPVRALNGGNEATILQNGKNPTDFRAWGRIRRVATGRGACGREIIARGVGQAVRLVLPAAASRLDSARDFDDWGGGKRRGAERRPRSAARFTVVWRARRPTTPPRPAAYPRRRYPLLGSEIAIATVTPVRRPGVPFRDECF